MMRLSVGGAGSLSGACTTSFSTTPTAEVVGGSGISPSAVRAYVRILIWPPVSRLLPCTPCRTVPRFPIWVRRRGSHCSFRRDSQLGRRRLGSDPPSCLLILSVDTNSVESKNPTCLQPCLQRNSVPELVDMHGRISAPARGKASNGFGIDGAEACQYGEPAQDVERSPYLASGQRLMGPGKRGARSRRRSNCGKRRRKLARARLLTRPPATKSSNGIESRNSIRSAS